MIHDLRKTSSGAVEVIDGDPEAKSKTKKKEDELPSFASYFSLGVALGVVLLCFLG